MKLKINILLGIIIAAILLLFVDSAQLLGYYFWVVVITGTMYLWEGSYNIKNSKK